MDVRLNTLNYSLKYNAPRIINTESAIGINGMLQNNKSRNATDFPIPDYDLYDGGIYGYTKWKKNKWTISGGIRYDLRQVRWNDFYTGTDPVTGFGRHVKEGVTGAILQFAAYQKTFSGLSASLGMTCQLSDLVSLKANIGRAYRAPNITEIASNGLDPGAHIIYLGNRNFNPEFSLQEDIGVRVRLNDFSADMSLFNNRIQNYIYLSLVADASGDPVINAQGNKTYQYEQAAAQLYGAEIWLAVHPQRWQGFRFETNLAMVEGFNRKPDYKNKGIAGEYLPLMPPLKLLGSVAQTIKPGSQILTSLVPKIEIEMNAAQNRYLSLNGTETPTPGYTLFNAGMVMELKCTTKQILQVQLQINNLFDRVYQSNLNRLKYFEYYTRSPNGYSGIYNMGRNSCLKIVVAF